MMRGLENIRVSDRNFWERDTSLDASLWLDAIEAIDRESDWAAFAMLSKAAIPKSKQVERYISDLHRRLTRCGRGRRANPAYDRSPAQLRWLLAVAEVRTAIAKGKTKKDALTDVAARFKVQRRQIAHRLKKGLP
ncbi:MAG: hypothetical protein J0H44_13630 [Alphaproteobacteria bacterium]|nr:hypothetical protein [Alphaproteobacteria bacterium]